MKRIGVVGARGHTGSQLLTLVQGHPGLEIGFVGSRTLAGQPVPNFPTLQYEAIEPESLNTWRVDGVVLALPNGSAGPFVDALNDVVDRTGEPTTIVDLSADHRFDDRWVYGLVETQRERIAAAKRIANPGCYATAAQLALTPFVDHIAEEPRIFGVSGFSGAGTQPSPKNDPANLRDNLLPYAPIGHTHEREISHHLGQTVRFMPHVAAFFRGITLTIDVTFKAPTTADEVFRLCRDHYQHEPLVSVDRDPPAVRDNVGRHDVRLGGFAASGKRVVLVATIDNLLKGAATQALQNLNLALGLPELAGIKP